MKKFLIICVVLQQILSISAVPFIYGDIDENSRLIHSEHLSKSGTTFEPLYLEKTIEVKDIIHGVKLDIASGVSAIVEGGVGHKSVKIVSTGFGNTVPIDTKVEIYTNGSALTRFSIVVCILSAIISYTLK